MFSKNNVEGRTLFHCQFCNKERIKSLFDKLKNTRDLRKMNELKLLNHYD